MSDRIVIATTWHHSAVAQQFHALAERLHADGVEVHLLDDRRSDKSPDPAPMVLHRWPGSGRPSGPGALRWAYGLLCDLRPSAVIANFAGVAPLGPAAWAARVPTRLAWFHTSISGNQLDRGRSLGTQVGLARRRLVHACYTDVVAVSAAAAAELDAEGGRRGRPTLVQHNAVADGVQRAHPAGPDAPIVCVGRFEPSKGQDVLLRAAAALPEPRRVVLLGGGSQRAALEALAEELELSVDLPGFLGPAEVRAEMAGAAVVVVPSRAEGFGMVAVEGLAAGVPVIASAVGGLAEVVLDGRTGALVRPDDPDALVRALHEALEPDRNAELGRAAREDYLARFTLDAWAASVAGLLGR